MRSNYILLILAVAFGVIAGFFIGLCYSTPALYAIIDYEVKAADWLAFAGAVIAALLTVAAAAAVSFSQSYIQKKRALAGARALLSADLSEIMDYLEESAFVVRSAIEHLEMGNPNQITEIPNLKADVLLRLGTLVTLADPRDSAELSKLVSNLQVQGSRLKRGHTVFAGHNRGRRRGVIRSSRNFDGALRTTIELYVQTENLFEYAREDNKKAERPLYDQRHIKTAINALGLESLQGAGVYERIFPKLRLFERPSQN